MILMISLHCNQNAMLYQFFLRDLDHIFICLRILLSIDVYIRTIEGDGEKPSRHENEGPSLYFPSIFGL